MTPVVSLSATQTVATIFGGLSIFYGSRALYSPQAFARDFGFPPPKSAGPADGKSINPLPRDPFITATGGRTVALGLSILILAAKGDLWAAGIVVTCCAVSGLMDTVSCYAAGKIGPTWQHAIGAVVLVSAGQWLTKA